MENRSLCAWCRVGQVEGLQTTRCLQLGAACGMVRLTPCRCASVLTQLLSTAVRIGSKLDLWSDSDSFTLKIVGLGRTVFF